MRSWYLLYLCLAQSATAAVLQQRQDNSPDPSLTKCPGDLPGSCPSGTECMPTNEKNTSVICCPQGANCNLINQILCDISQQNAQEYPGNQVHTSELTAQLPSCGSQCCPLGYNCAGNLCKMQDKTPQPASTPNRLPGTHTPSPSSTTQPVVFGTTPPTNDPLSEQDPQPHSVNKKAIAIAVPLSIMAVCLVLLAIFWILKRRRKQNAEDSYLSDKTLHRSSSHSTDFMGTTPRPLSLPQQYIAPLSSPPAHIRSQSEPQVPTRSTTSSSQPSSANSLVSQPMWDPNLSGGAPLHRTDFLLRRGSVETGYEDKIKPSWSTRRHSRPKSSLNPARNMRRTHTEPQTLKTPVTPATARSSRRASRLAPLFSTPLRFGLPLSPSPAKNKTPPPPARPPRSDENLARLVKLEGKSVPSGEAKRISAAAPSPKKAKKMRLRDRSESSRRPLVADTSREGSVDPAGRRGTSLERMDSDASATTIESSVSSGSGVDGERGRGRHGQSDSTETINVLLPPPEVFHTPPPPLRTPERKNVAGGGLQVPKEETKRETTFEELMTKAGWRRSEWVKK